MIEGKLVRSLSQVTSFKAEALEKDYVMNLILDAIANCPQTRDSFFFKGGSCIYKCFYHNEGVCGSDALKGDHPLKKRPKDLTKNYLTHVRLSSDLDLTVHPDMMNEEKLNQAFQAVGAYLKENHGLEIDGFSFPIHENEKQEINGRNKRNCRGELHFKGPLFNPKFGAPKLKLDLTADETVVFQPYRQEICHPYDPNGKKLLANTYTFRDVFAEKFRSLFERCSAHDLFDVVFLSDHPYMKDPGRQLGIGLAIIEKFRIKNMPLALDDQAFSMRIDQKELIDAQKAFKDNWKKMMPREKGDSLMPFDQAWERLNRVLDFGRNCVKMAQNTLKAYQLTHPKVDLNTALATLNARLDHSIAQTRNKGRA